MDPLHGDDIGGSTVHPGAGACENAARIPVRAQHQISWPEVEQRKVSGNPHAVGLQRRLGVGKCADAVCTSRGAGNVGHHGVVSGPVRGLVTLAPGRGDPQQIETGGTAHIWCGHHDASRSVGQRPASVEGVGGSVLGVPGDNVVAVIRIFGSREPRNPSRRSFSALNLNCAALRDHAGLPNLACRILAAAHFLVHIGQLKPAVTASLRAHPNAILRKALYDAVRNAQRVAGLPVNSVAPTLQSDIQVFQPADSGKGSKRSRCINHRIARRRVASNSVIPAASTQSGVESVQ